MHGKVPVGENAVGMKSKTGTTAEGMPLAYSVAPCAELDPWVTRIGVTSVSLPAGASIECGTFSEHPAIRMIYGADWTAMTADGPRRFSPGERGLALYFGPCTRMMPLSANGSFRVTSIYFKPGATVGLNLPPVEETNDRIIAADPFTGEEQPLPGYAPQADPERWYLSAQQAIQDSLERAALKEPSALMREFERLCLTDPGATILEFAEAHGITPRTLERTIRRTWGVSPKFALRRARALDMAAALLAVAHEDEEAELRLRYFDQSHLNREIRHFFGTTPGKLETGEHPLLTITMELRQSRRLETLARLGIDEPRPWRDPAAEPPSLSRTAS